MLQIKKDLAARFPGIGNSLAFKKINFPLAAPSANISTSIIVMVNTLERNFKQN